MQTADVKLMGFWRTADWNGIGTEMERAYYSESVAVFLQRPQNDILGSLSQRSDFPVEPTQRDAWLEQVGLLREVLKPYAGCAAVWFEYSIPRLGRRIDVVLIIQHVLFVLEFKVGEREFTASAIDQVWDYALDLKNFHEASHQSVIAPVLVATQAPDKAVRGDVVRQANGVLMPIRCNGRRLGEVIGKVLAGVQGPVIDVAAWEAGRYCPTPTIVEAAMALYRGHSVAEISRNEAGDNLTTTAAAVSEIIKRARIEGHRDICFVTGVPGAGKTLVGLKIATEHRDKHKDLYSVFLSGNGPLVAILREALARDHVRDEREHGRQQTLKKARSTVEAFIQNVHRFRDECLIDPGPPIEHVALFDEAQRAWTKEQTCKFMRQRSRLKRRNFNQSEPHFLISCLNRHQDWAVIVCLVGGGQEINTGEAGIGEWIKALKKSFRNWHVHISSRLTDSEYGAGEALKQVARLPNVSIRDELHLGVSMRSFRAENVSALVKQVLDLQETDARETLKQISDKYPIVLTRDLKKAKNWVRERAQGSERYGIVASSQAQRLKPYAIDVKSPMEPVHWFLDGKEDVRSSYYLEDVATEFHVQGLELDWACVTWDGDFRRRGNAWEHWSFCGDRWNRILMAERQSYQKNAYRVLLTRARQGMVICVPEGDADDPTRASEYYDPTYEYLKGIGFWEI